MAEGEALAGKIKDDAAEGLALRFVDSHRPGEVAGEMIEAGIATLDTKRLFCLAHVGSQ